MSNRGKQRKPLGIYNERQQSNQMKRVQMECVMTVSRHEAGYVNAKEGNRGALNDYTRVGSSLDIHDWSSFAFGAASA